MLKNPFLFLKDHSVFSCKIGPLFFKKFSFSLFSKMHFKSILAYNEYFYFFDDIKLGKDGKTQSSSSIYHLQG